MGTCAVIGQEVDTVAALGIKIGLVSHDMYANLKFFRQVQQQLLLDDCFIPGVKNKDEADLALLAEVTASNFLESGQPEMVVSGETRAVLGKNGVWAG